MKKLKIKSVTDVITNSSSEVFVVKTDLNREELLKSLKDASEFDGSSGMGGYLEVFDNDYSPKNEWYSNNYRGLLPENVLVVDIDWELKTAINWMIKNLDVISTDTSFKKVTIDPETRRITSITEGEKDEGIYEFFEYLDKKDYYNSLVEIQSLEDYYEKYKDWFNNRIGKKEWIRETKEFIKNFPDYEKNIKEKYKV